MACRLPRDKKKWIHAPRMLTTHVHTWIGQNGYDRITASRLKRCFINTFLYQYRNEWSNEKQKGLPRILGWNTERPISQCSICTCIETSQTNTQCMTCYTRIERRRFVFVYFIWKSIFDSICFVFHTRVSMFLNTIETLPYCDVKTHAWYTTRSPFIERSHIG